MNERTGWPRIGPIVLLLGALSVLSIGGCSLQNTTAVQCLSESECLAKGPAFANTTCDPTTKTCVALQSGQDLCKATTDCVTSHGPEYICRRSDKKCVALKTPECPFLMDSPTIASYKDPNVIILGALTPANDNALGTMMEKSVELAQQDFSTSDNFLPPVTGTTATRPVVIVGCNEFGAGNDGLLRAANHLVKDLQVPIILGPVDSGNDAVVEVNVALPNKVLSILPTSTLSGLSSLPSMSTALLTWRLNYSDATLASTVGDLFKTVLPARAQTLGIIHAGDPLKVAVIEENNLFGLTIGGKVQAQIQFNGKSAIDNAQDQPPHYMLGNVGDQRDTVNNPRPDATVAAVVAAVLQFQPHIIVHASAVIGVTKVLIPLEAQWPMGVPRPIHVGANPSWASGALSQWIAGQAARAQRIFIIRGRLPAADSTTAANQLQWNSRFYNFFKEAAGVQINPLLYLWYDATYLATYAAAAVGSNPLTGENAASLGMPKLSVQGALDIPPTPDKIGTALGALSSGGSIKYSGLSGPLNLDPKTGAPVSDTEAACPDLNGNFVSSGYAFLASSTQLGLGNITPYTCDTTSKPPKCKGCQ